MFTLVYKYIYDYIHFYILPFFGVGGATPGAGGASLVVPAAYFQPITQAGTRKVPQCGGGLACESKLQGEIDGYDYSNYQLFRCSSWDSFYRLVDKLNIDNQLFIGTKE